jgi:hypothetical protein
LALGLKDITCFSGFGGNRFESDHPDASKWRKRSFFNDDDVTDDVINDANLIDKVSIL